MGLADRLGIAQRSGRRLDGQLLGEEVVAPVPIRHLDHLALGAEAGDVVHEYELHPRLT